MTPFLPELELAGVAEGIFKSPGKCLLNCSYHGECHQGVCVCQVSYKGQTCSELNTAYLVSFGVLFVLLGTVALIQLLLCVKSDYERRECTSIRTALEVTTQKLLYILTICAAAIRGAYFLSKWSASPIVASNLMSAYYPFLITGCSLIVCFWAEAFHLSSDVKGSARFLSKSTLAFITFNVILYLLLMSELVMTLGKETDHPLYTTQIFNAVFAVFMLILAILFLTYGVEVYFKLRGAFRQSLENLDPTQLHMSRLGLVFQGSLQLITTVLLAFYAQQEIWAESLPVLSSNFYVIGFHIAEFLVVLWFPCVLWNCKSPDQLWVLNPQKLFLAIKTGEVVVPQDDSVSIRSRQSSIGLECWICYESAHPDFGPLIQPCACKGDVRAVHHECLRTWILQSYEGRDIPRCTVCKEQYLLDDSEAIVSLPRGFTPRHRLQAVLSLFVFMCCPFADYVAYRYMHSTTYIVLVIGFTIIVQLACLKFLGRTLREAYKRAKLISVKIEGKPLTADPVYCVGSGKDLYNTY